VYLNPVAVVWKNMVATTCAMMRLVPFVGPVKVTAIYYNSKLDEDNGNKLLRDSLEGFAYVNDRQIKASAGEKRKDRGSPRVVVTVEAVKPC
jgi:Holliday junction resolvase RusA-like endonuclease